MEFLLVHLHFNNHSIKQKNEFNYLNSNKNNILDTKELNMEMFYNFGGYVTVLFR